MAFWHVKSWSWKWEAGCDGCGWCEMWKVNVDLCCFWQLRKSKYDNVMCKAGREATWEKTTFFQIILIENNIVDSLGSVHAEDNCIHLPNRHWFRWFLGGEKGRWPGTEKPSSLHDQGLRHPCHASKMTISRKRDLLFVLFLGEILHHLGCMMYKTL